MRLKAWVDDRLKRSYSKLKGRKIGETKLRKYGRHFDYFVQRDYPNMLWEPEREWPEDLRRRITYFFELSQWNGFEWRSVSAMTVTSPQLQVILGFWEPGVGVLEKHD